MYNYYRQLFVVLFFISTSAYSTVSHADILLLIHGYLGDANSWETSGINSALNQQGWLRGGMFKGSPTGPKLFVTKHAKAENLVYVATLPSQSSIASQAQVLQKIIDIIALRHPQQKIILVGHSAGGVVARMTIVRSPSKNIKALITIASPHLGTRRASQALDITANHGPFNLVKNFIGGDDYKALKYSRALMRDLTRPNPGNMLYWLNSQPHPAIFYTSIIRTKNQGNTGDYYVPGDSQNMNNVPVLKGRSATFLTPTAHFLVKQDAETILSVINHFKD